MIAHIFLSTQDAFQVNLQDFCRIMEMRELNAW